MISMYCWKLIVTTIRKLKRVHKLGQYSKVQKICIIKPAHIYKGAVPYIINNTILDLIERKASV